MALAMGHHPTGSDSWLRGTSPDTAAMAHKTVGARGVQAPGPDRDRRA